MGANCCGGEDKPPADCCKAIDDNHGWDCRYKHILIIVLLINAGMFIVEIISGVHAQSQALLADAIDFFSDAFNYAISIYVLNKSITSRAKASLLKAAMMALLGVWVLGSTIYKAFVIGMPQAEIMGTIGFMALVANIISALLLYKFRSGDSNRESAWICSRNDAIGNIAVMLAAAGVFASGTKWPDLFVAVIISSLALSGAYKIIKSARKELAIDNSK